MAYYIPKIKIGNTTYNVKDLEARNKNGILESAIDRIQEMVLTKEDSGINIGNLVSGSTINAVTGANVTVNYGTRTDYINIDHPILVKFSFDLSVYLVDVFTYSNHSVGDVADNLANGEWSSKSSFLVLPPEGISPCFRIGIKRADGSAMTTSTSDTTSDFYKIKNGIKIYRSDWTDSALSLSISDRKSIAGNSDLDDFTVVGNYYCGGGISVVNSISNKPVSLTNNFILFVISSINSNRIIQVIQESSLTPYVYERYYNGSSWTEWKRLATDEDISDTENRITASNVLLPHSSGTVTQNGITIKTDGKGTYKISGTASTSTSYNIYYNENALPSWAKKGNTYKVKISIPSRNTRFRIATYDGDTWTTHVNTFFNETFTIPVDAVGMYIRFFCFANGLNSPEFEVHPEIYEEKSFGAIYGKLDQPYFPPMLTIVDDDGYGYFYRDLKPLCEEKNVSISSAVVTGYMGQRTGYMTWEQVQACYASGCEILSHGYNHKTDTDIIQDENTAEELETWYRMAKHDLQLHGIKSDFFVFNNNTANVIQCQQAVKRVYKGALHAAGGNINGPNANPYYIERFNFTAGSSSEPHTLQEMKDNIDTLVAAGTGWDVWMIHTSSTGGWSSDEVTKLGAAIDYARAHGVQVVTVEYAMRHYYGIS